MLFCLTCSLFLELFQVGPGPHKRQSLVVIARATLLFLTTELGTSALTGTLGSRDILWNMYRMLRSRIC